MRRILFIVLLPLVLLSCRTIITHESGVKIYSDSIKRFYIPQYQYEELDWIYFKLAEDFTLPNGMVIKKDTQATLHKTGYFMSFVLAQDWQDPKNGWVMKADQRVDFYDNAKPRSFTLAADWRDKSGRVFKGGTVIKATNEYLFYEYTLAENWRDPQTGVVLKAGVKQQLPVKGGSPLPEIVLARDWIHPDWKIVLAADSKVGFSKDGQIISFFPAQDWQEPTTGVVIKQGTKVSLFPGGKFLSFTLAQGFTAPAGYVLKAGTVVEFNEKGGMKKATFAKPWRDPATGVNYQADKEYSF